MKWSDEHGWETEDEVEIREFESGRELSEDDMEQPNFEMSEDTDNNDNDDNEGDEDVL
jgi:hypothetical protein